MKRQSKLVQNPKHIRSLTQGCYRPYPKGTPGRLRPVVVMLSLLLVSRAAQGQSTSPLAARGYSVLPVPQKVLLNGPDFEFGERWQLRLESGVKPDDDAIKSLTEGLQSRFHLKLAPSGRAGLIHLRLAAGLVTIGEATDRKRPALAEQAYHLALKPQTIDITANAPPGLYYGVQTLMQLITPR